MDSQVIDYKQLILSNLTYIPNDQQEAVVGVLSRFCGPKASDDAVLLLNGYAGTGKTSLCGALVQALHTAGRGVVLLAPTGRAAKVFSRFASTPAYTIHRAIYRYGGLAGAIDGGGKRQTIPNAYTNTVFIVDEASMISGPDAAGNDILEDLIHYVYSGTGCKLMLVGDTAQLPPVGCDFSPAMSADVLRGYGLHVTSITITKVARQQAMSGILANATTLRRAMKAEPLPAPKILTGYPDVRVIDPEDVPEELYNVYRRDGISQSIVITRSNQRASGFNREIRASVLYIEERLAKGELLMVSKNNYSPSKENKEVRFLANGDIVEIAEVYGTEMKYGFHFANVRITIPETDQQLDAKILINTLAVDGAHLSQEDYNTLYYSIMEDPELFTPYTPVQTRLDALRRNPYWNALHVKYAYAVTCHKAQGGQWKNVFVDMSYVPAEAMGMDFYRWLYTAETRATDHLYIIK